MTARREIAETERKFGELRFVQSRLIEKNGGDGCEILKEGSLHVQTSRDIFEMLGDTELDCGEEIVKISMSHDIIFLLIWSIDMNIKATQESGDSKNSPERTDLLSPACRRFGGWIQGFSGVLPKDTNLIVSERGKTGTYPSLVFIVWTREEGGDIFFVECRCPACTETCKSIQHECSPEGPPSFLLINPVPALNESLLAKQMRLIQSH